MYAFCSPDRYPAHAGFILSDHRYYEGGVSSVYLWELEDGGFAGVVLFKKGTVSLYVNMGRWLI